MSRLLCFSIFTLIVRLWKAPEQPTAKCSWEIFSMKNKSKQIVDLWFGEEAKYSLYKTLKKNCARSYFKRNSQLCTHCHLAANYLLIWIPAPTVIATPCGDFSEAQMQIQYHQPALVVFNHRARSVRLKPGVSIFSGVILNTNFAQTVSEITMNHFAKRGADVAPPLLKVILPISNDGCKDIFPSHAPLISVDWNWVECSGATDWRTERNA